jgi:hypothetical protein
MLVGYVRAQWAQALLASGAVCFHQKSREAGSHGCR